MNRRSMIKRAGLTVGLVAIGGPAVLLQTACGGLASAATLVVDTLKEIQPVLKDLVPGSVDLIAKAIIVAENLRAAVKDGKGDPLTYLREFIAPDGLFNKILDQIGLVQDPTKRKIISGIFAIAGISLRLIAARLEANQPQSMNGESNADKLEEAAKSLRF